MKRISGTWFVLFLFMLMSSCTGDKEGECPGNISIIKRYIDEVVVGKDYSLLEELVDDDFVNELSPQFRLPTPAGPRTEGRQLHLEHLRALHKERDVIVKYIDIVCQGDLVAISMLVTHHYHDGRLATFPWMSIYKVKNGRIIRVKSVHDTLMEYMQLKEESKNY